MLWLPLLPARLCHHSRQLAEDVAEPCQLTNVPIPRIHQTIRNSGLGNVIQYKSLLRKFPDQFHRDGQVSRMEEQVVCQPVFGQSGDASPKLRPQHELVIGLILQYVAHSDKFEVCGKLFQLRR